MPSFGSILVLLGLSLLVPVVARAQPQFAQTTIQINNKALTVELAIEEQQHAYGLMHRRRLPEELGMLFIFQRDQLLNFYMKNTLIDLSIAYIDRSGLIREIYPMQANSLALVGSKWPMRYALEVNQGWFKRHQVKVGDSVSLPLELLKAARLATSN